MRNKLFMPIGMLCLAMCFLLERYTQTSDFLLGLLVGLSIGLNLVGAFQKGKWIRKQSSKNTNN